MPKCFALAREALHGAPQRQLSAGDPDRLIRDRDGVRPPQGARAIAGNFALGARAMAKIAEVPAKRTEMPHAVILRIGYEQMQPIIHRHARGIRISCWRRR